MRSRAAGNPEVALEATYRGEPLLRSAGDPVRLAMSLGVRAQALLALDRPAEAAPLVAEAAEVAERLGLGPDAELCQLITSLRAQ